MYALGFTLYFALSLVQAAAIVSGLALWLGVGTVSAAPVGLLLGFVPLAGTAVAVAGAVDGWAWPLEGALAAFIGPLVLMLLIAFHAGWKQAGEGLARETFHPLKSILNRPSSSR